MSHTKSSLPCSVSGCQRPLHAGGLCKLHYYRLRNTGTTDDRKPPSASERFWSKVNKDGLLHPTLGTACWLWTASTCLSGYGTFGFRRRLIKAHRYSWELHHGTIPDGLFVLHRCDVSRCVNPDHLFLGTLADNAADRDCKGRQARGESCGTSRLTVEQVIAIRLRHRKGSSTDGSTALAREYKVHHSTIRNIISRFRWKHVE
jgi:hypothetical protein